ncbi:MAG: ROK family protein [Firmicutes bacterium]|nr:ROK family protein [Bacillota bacterium]
MFGAVEAGGTKFVCAVGTEEGELVDVRELPTRAPGETLPLVADYFRAYDLQALGVGSFGPVDLAKGSPTFGMLTSTPKLEWRGTNICRTLAQELGVPTFVLTDVGAAALGEVMRGGHGHLESCLYITVGTGIGAALFFHGEIFSGVAHPEMGHIAVRRAPNDTFQGACPSHTDCLEGLASGTAIRERWGVPGDQLPVDHEAWPIEAHYLADGVVNFIYTLYPERMILGGGIMRQPRLLGLVRENVIQRLNGYHVPQPITAIDEYLVLPRLGPLSGVYGALDWAIRQYRRRLLVPGK